MKCPRCKRQLREGARFCPACGAAVTMVTAGKRSPAIAAVLIPMLLLSVFLGSMALSLCLGSSFPTVKATEQRPEPSTEAAEDSVPLLAPSLYVGTDRPYDLLAIQSVQGQDINFAAWWYRLYALDASASMQQGSGDFEYESDGPSARVTGSLIVRWDSAQLDIRSSTFDPLEAKCYSYTYVGDRFPESRLPAIRSALSIPENMDAEVLYGGLSFDDTMTRYLQYIRFLQGADEVASAEVDYLTGEVVQIHKRCIPQNLVTDAYYDTIPQNAYNLPSYFQIPKVTADLPQIDGTNKFIYDQLYNYLQENVYGLMETGIATGLESMSYIWGKTDRHLSILICLMWGGKPTCYPYTISLETGGLVEDGDILADYGMGWQEFADTVTRRGSPYQGDTLSSPVPYINPGNGDLCAVSISDQWCYSVLLDLTSPSSIIYPWDTSQRSYLAS